MTAVFTGNPLIFGLTQLMETASCRPDCVIHSQHSNIHARKHRTYYLVDLLLERARRAFRIWDPSLFHHLLVLEKPEATAGSGPLFEKLPKVTVQLPIFNEVYVAERLLRSVSELDYPQELLQIQVLDDSTDEHARLPRRVLRNCANAASTSSGSIGLIGPALRLAPSRADRCCGRRFSLHPRRRLCSGKGSAQTHRPFLYRSKSRNDSNAVGPSEPRVFAAHTHAGDVFGWTSFA